MQKNFYILKNKYFILFSILLFTINLDAKSLTLGVFPYSDAARLATLHKPLKDYLSIKTNNQIRLVSANSFKVFKERTSSTRYDILITAPHFGRSAQKITNYEWLGFTSNTSHSVFISHKDSKIDTIKDLGNKSIALPPKSAIIHHLALNTLSKQGIISGKNLTLSVQKSHTNAILSVLQKNTDAASVGAPTWKRYKSSENALKKIGISEDIPGFAIMIRSTLPLEIKEAIKTALFSFPKTKEGKLYFKETGLKGIRKETKDDMNNLDKYLNLINKSLRKTKSD